MLDKATLLAITPKLIGFDDEAMWTEDVFTEYHVKDRDNFTILYAWYENEDYNGHSYVFGYDKKEDKFFEVEAWHCSCYGLEEGWDPEYFESVELLTVYMQRCKALASGDGQNLFINYLTEIGIEV